MFIQTQTCKGLWMGAAVVLVLGSAATAQFQGASVKVSSKDVGPASAIGGSASFTTLVPAIEIEWFDLGFALDGLLGPPKFKGSGTIQAGERSKLILSSAAPLAPAILFVSLDSAPQPFKGGMLAPALPSLVFVTMTDGEGGIELAISASANLPAGFALVMQYAVADAAAVQGVALSNALQTSTH